MLNFLAIGGRKLWIWRKEKKSAASGIQIQPEFQNAPMNNGFAFNNMIHNKDVLSSKQIQGDPNQNFPFQMAVTSKPFIFDPILVKPKCVKEAAVF